MFNGYEMWKPDVESCTRYRISNPNGSGCGRCMKVCPFNKEGLFQHRLALHVAIRFPALRRILICLDDLMGYGKRNPLWKWWLDLEIRNGKVVKPDKTNQRDLQIKRPRPVNQRIALYPAETNPPPNSVEPCPVNRADAKARSDQP